MITNTNGPQSPAGIQLVEGAKNPSVSPSLGNTTLNICTYNVRTLLEDRLVELMLQVDNMNWDIIGVCETRMKRENLAHPE